MVCNKACTFERIKTDKQTLKWLGTQLTPTPLNANITVVLVLSLSQRLIEVDFAESIA